MKQPRVGLLGCGRWGRNHFRVLRQLGALTLTYDPDPEVLLPGTSRAERAGSDDELLASPEVDAVVIATPARSHYELARRALLAGKDVLVEKPLTLDEAEGRDLVALAEARGRILMVGHVTLYHPGIRKLAELIRAGELGDLRYLYSNRLNLGTVRCEEDILWSFAPHDIAVLLELVGSWPQTVQATGGAYLQEGRADVTVTHLAFPGGTRAHIFVSWLHPMKEHRLVVIGSRRMAGFTDGPEGGELVLYDRGVDVIDDRPVLRKNDGHAISTPWREPLLVELEHFLDCVRTRRRPQSDGRHGLEVLRILGRAHASLREGGLPLDCPPLPEEATADE